MTRKESLVALKNVFTTKSNRGASLAFIHDYTTIHIFSCRQPSSPWIYDAMTGVEEEDVERETNETKNYPVIVEKHAFSVMQPRRRMKRDHCRCQWLFCLYLLIVFMSYPNTVVAQESTPAPVRIPGALIYLMCISLLHKLRRC